MHQEAGPAWLKEVQTEDGMFAVNRNHCIASWNSAAERITGIKAVDAIGRQCGEVLTGAPDPDRGFCRRTCAAFEHALKGQATPSANIVCRSAQGAPLAISMSTLVTTRDQQIALVHTFRDASPWQRSPEAPETFSGRKAQKSTPAQAVQLKDSVRQLSRREAQALAFLDRGMSTLQIAESLEISPLTARNHVGRLLDRLGAHNRLEAVAIARRAGLLDGPQATLKK